MKLRPFALAAAALVILPGAIQAGGQAVVQVAQPLATFNPLVAPDHPAMPLVFSGLLTVDKEGRPAPELAAVVPTVEAGTIQTAGEHVLITYRLRSGLRWHDGRPVTAADAVFTWQALKAAGKADTMPIVDAKALAPDRLQLRIRRQPTDLTKLLRFVVPKRPFATPTEALDPQHPFWQWPIGTGPFRVAEWIPGVRLRANANKDFYRGRAHLDQVIVQFGRPMLPSPTGQVQFWTDIPFTWWPKLSANAPTSPWQLTVTPKPSWIGMSFNLRGPLGERSLRLALLRGFDRARLASDVVGGGDVAIAGIRPGAPKIPYTPNEAKQLWGNEAAVLTIVHVEGGIEDATAKALERQWLALGIPVRRQGVSPAAYESRVMMGDFDIAIAERQPGRDDGRLAYASDAVLPIGHNESTIADRRLDELLQAEADALGDKARQLRKDAVDKRLTELAPGSALFHLPVWHASRKGLVIDASHPWGPLWGAHRWHRGG